MQHSNTLPIILPLQHSVIHAENSLSYSPLYSSEYHVILNNTKAETGATAISRQNRKKLRNLFNVNGLRIPVLSDALLRLKSDGRPCKKQGRSFEKKGYLREKYRYRYEKNRRLLEKKHETM